MPLQQSAQGGSGSFLVRCDDGRRYWCKTLNNAQSGRVPVNEQIVGRWGALIGAPVCTVALVQVPVALVGWEFRPGLNLVEGWAHGSMSVEQVTETRGLGHRADDHNAKRHAGLIALYDWLGGQDHQWLVEGPAGNAYWSHDHGHYFPSGPDWTTASLATARDQAFAVASYDGLDRTEMARLATRLDDLTRTELEEAVAMIPTDWPVSDLELDALVEFADHRRAAVATRLRDAI